MHLRFEKNPKYYYTAEYVNEKRTKTFIKMGLDMRPLGKPIPGFEERFLELFRILRKGEFRKPSFLDKIINRKVTSEEELRKEWFEILIPSYETIKAPRVGRDEEANRWIKKKYDSLYVRSSFEEYRKDYEGYYVIELAKEKDGVPVYISEIQDENVFRGQFLDMCVDLIGKELVQEAWNTKLAQETLNYGNRLMNVTDKIANQYNLEYLKVQRYPPDTEKESIELKVHVLFSLSKWLIFYGENGHGYEADY